MLKGKKGFTLIELMIVITIIAILITITIPSYRSYRQRTSVSNNDLNVITQQEEVTQKPVAPSQKPETTPKDSMGKL